MKRWLLEEIWLGGRESPQLNDILRDIFESPSKIIKKSPLKILPKLFLKSKDVQYCDRNNHLSGKKKY